MEQAKLDTVLDKIVKVSGDAQALHQTLTDSMPFLLNELKPEQRQELGYKMEELIHFCEFNQIKCDLMRYSIYAHRRRGRCQFLPKFLQFAGNFKKRSIARFDRNIRI